MQEEYEEEMERVVSFCCYARYLYTFVLIVFDMNLALHFSNLRWNAVLCYIFFRRLSHYFGKNHF